MAGPGGKGLRLFPPARTPGSCLLLTNGKSNKLLMKKRLIAFAAFAITTIAFAADKKIVFIAGPPSHGPGEHEHRAGCLLLKSCLDNVPGVVSTVYSNGWPPNAGEAFERAAALVVYSDGGPG